MKEYIACSVTVADGDPGPTTSELEAELARYTHDLATAHYALKVPTSKCSFKTFAGDRGERQMFERFLETVLTPVTVRNGHMTEWDKAERPVAAVHWFFTEE